MLFSYIRKIKNVKNFGYVNGRNELSFLEKEINEVDGYQER